MCMKVCVCGHVNCLKEGVAMRVANCKKGHNFQKDSQTCIRFNGTVGHEQKDGFLGQMTKKGAWQWEWPVTKRHITSEWIHVTCVCGNIHTHTTGRSYCEFAFVFHVLKMIKTVCM